MPRSSSLAITIAPTATDALADPAEIRAFIDTAIEHLTQIAGLPETIGPSVPAARPGTPDRAPRSPQHKPESVEWFRAVLAAPSFAAELRRFGIAIRVSALAG